MDPRVLLSMVWDMGVLLKRDTRARLTPVDVAWISIGVFILGLLLPTFYELMNQNVDALGVGDAYLLRAIPGAAILAVFVLIMATAVEGA